MPHSDTRRGRKWRRTWGAAVKGREPGESARTEGSEVCGTRQVPDLALQREKAGIMEVRTLRVHLSGRAVCLSCSTMPCGSDEVLVWEGGTVLRGAVWKTTQADSQGLAMRGQNLTHLSPF